MSDFGWKSLLKRWSEVTLASSAGENLPAATRAAGWMGFPPATETQIAAAEERLKIPLPPSYKAFLRTSNGWLRPGHAIDRVFGIEQIEWFRKQNREWISAYTKPAQFMPPEKTPDDEYFAYGRFAADFRTEHLKEALQISEIGDGGVYLLNPQVINKDGEWEAWFLANWLPGVRRYRSFEEMMRAEFSEFSGGEWRPPDGIVGELPDEYVGSPGSPKRRVKKRTRPRLRKILGKPYNQWTVDELLEMLRNPEFGIIHDEVIEGLGLLGNRRAVEPLIGLVDIGGNAAIHALGAIKKLAPERLPELLLEVLRRPNSYCRLAAAGMVAELRDDRAIPVIVDIMRDTKPEGAHEADYIGSSLALFGTGGYNALVGCLHDPEPKIRHRALNALHYTNRPEAREVIRPLLDDPEPAVRDAAKLILDLLPPIRAAEHR